MKTSSGLEYIEVEAGNGAQAEAGKTVAVHYASRFQDPTSKADRPTRDSARGR